MHTPKLFEITDNAIIEYCVNKNELQLSKGSAFPVSTHIPIDLIGVSREKHYRCAANQIL